jgi:predicted transcriptional regulator
MDHLQEWMMTHSTVPISMSLRAARAAEGLSQRALSERVDVPQSHICKVGSGSVGLRLYFR